MSDFRKALMITAIPIVALSLISIIPGVLDLPGISIFNSGIYGFAWLSAAVLWVAAIVAAIVFAVRDRRSMAAGILAGIGIGVVSLGATCFANLAGW